MARKGPMVLIQVAKISCVDHRMGTPAVGGPTGAPGFGAPRPALDTATPQAPPEDPVVDTPARPSWTTPLPQLPTPAGPDVAALHRRAGGENFTVASLLLPPRFRRRLMSIYA